MAYGIQTAKNLDAYLRARRKVPYLEMLDRYGAVEAKERALDAYHGRSVLDRLER